MEVFPLQPHKSIGHWGASRSLERWEERKLKSWYKRKRAKEWVTERTMRGESKTEEGEGKMSKLLISYTADSARNRSGVWQGWRLGHFKSACDQTDGKREWKMIRRTVLEWAVMFSCVEPAARCQQRSMTPQRHAPLITVTSELLSARVTRCDETEEQVHAHQY